MLSRQTPHRTRILSVIAATIVALACGTNYVYSAWGPRFAQRLKLSSTESNLIGTCGNLGMYATGIPFGMVVDAKGPRWGVAIGTVLFGAGYYPLAKAFDAGPGIFHVATLCMFSFLTGAGSSSAFGAAIKAAALNFPEARGTATAFPLAAFGLSAFAFATVALAFPHDTPHFLLLLATGTVALPILSFPFLNSPLIQEYKAIPLQEITDTHRTRHDDNCQTFGHPDAGAQEPNPLQQHKHKGFEDDGDDTSSLFSTASSDAIAELEAFKTNADDSKTENPNVDIRGFALLRHVEFWQLFSLLGLLAGIGLMTINNIGNDVQALWTHSDPTVDSAYIAKRQVAHVSTLSVCSFIGRLLSGIGSDILVNKYNKSRFWCLVVSASGFAVAQIMVVLIESPDLLLMVAGLTGLAYGFLFGVFPSLTAHAFGVRGLSQNWGTMCLGPMIGGNVFNILYGLIYDSYSVIDQEGNRTCNEGRACYSKAYLATWTASLAGLGLCIWAIQHENRKASTIPVHQRTA